MDFELSKELRELQAAARHFVDRELVPHELYVDEHESIPADVLERIRAKAIEYGLWPMNVPRELGGLGSSVLAQVVAQEQAGRATNGLWAHVGGPYNALLRCDDAQRRKYLEPALRGEWTVSYAVSEPGGGSDTTNLKTTAEKRGDRWVINGEKWFVSGGNDGIGLLVHAVTGPDEETLFLVDHGTPGMRLSRTPRFMHRHEDRHPEFVFENCEVPESQMLGRRGEANAISKEWFREEDRRTLSQLRSFPVNAASGPQPIGALADFSIESGPSTIERIKPTITNTFELGYKGMASDRIMLSADVYFSKVNDFVGPLRTETPNVFMSGESIAEYVIGALTPLVLALQLPPDQLEIIATALATNLAQLPIGTIAPDQNTSDYDVTIAMQDSSGPFDYYLSRRLSMLCDSFGIEHSRDVFRHYRSDAAAALEAGNDIRTALVCFALDSSHGYERTHRNSVQAVASLLALYMQTDTLFERDAAAIGPLRDFPEEQTEWEDREVQAEPA